MRKGRRRNKEHYTPSIDAELDLHGFTADEARCEVVNFLTEGRTEGWHRVRIIVGKGMRSAGGIPVLPDTVKNILTAQGLSYTYAKIQDGGEGALEVTL